MSPVAIRLAAYPGARRFPGRQLDLFSVRDFLSPDQCAELCAMIDRDRRPSTLADDQGHANFRTSETCDLPDDHPLVRGVREAMAALTGIPMTHGEPLQGQRYAVGQEFRPHTDTFNPGSADYYAATADMGQRTWTAMAFLNQPEDGGATRFKTIGKTIQPETGKLLLWNNLLPDGAPKRCKVAPLRWVWIARRGPDIAALFRQCLHDRGLAASGETVKQHGIPARRYRE